MRASVIIVAYNSKSDLEVCLPALFTNLGKLDEVIVVDNASTDKTSEWLENFYPQVKLVASSENLGYAGGNNLGSLSADGEILAFLNPDTIVGNGWLDALIEVFEGDASVGLVTPKIVLRGNPDLINTCGTAVHMSGITLCRGLGMPRETFSDQEVIGAVSGAAFVIRRELFEKIGGFDENFFMYMEDIDLSLRAQLTGATCLFEPKSIVEHEFSLRFGPRKVFYQERNRYLMLLKTLRWSTLVLMLPTLLVAEIITWGFVLLQDRENYQNKFKAYTWIASNWTEILENRKRIQSQRTIPDRRLLKQMTFGLEFKQTGDSLATRFASLLFTPIFYLLQLFLYGVVWW
jgi:GT2 family glycosyltransferase